MNENDSAGQSGNTSPDGGSASQQRRRRRRRSRRRSSGGGQHNTPQQNSSQQNSSQDKGPDKQASNNQGSDNQGSNNETGGGNSGRSRSRSRRRRKPQSGDSRNQTSSASNQGQSRRSRSKGGAKNAPKGGTKTGSKSGAKASPASSRNRKQSSHRHRSPHHGGTRMETRDETSAGGLVISGLAEAVRENNEVDLSRIYVALIGRLDRRGRLLWSMPKGHVEPGEERSTTAEREVWEETGVHGQVIEELGIIDYWFVSDGVRIHKTVHHHLLRFVDGELNDEDPEVTEVAWIPASELIEHLAYADERKLARIAHDRLPELARAEHEAGRATPR